MRFSKFFLLFMGISLLAAGCRPQKSTSTPPALVTAVDVQYDSDEVHLHRKYTDTEKIDRVLYYLYTLAPYGPAEVPPQQRAVENCCITLTFSNGLLRTYRQRSGGYLCVDSSPWRTVDPEKAARLLPLIEQLPSD